MHSTLDMLKTLTELDGPSGYEHAVRKQMETYLGPFSDEVIRDRLGSIVGRKSGTAHGPKILVAGHLDEVGFLVSAVTDKGYLRFAPLGGWWSHVVLGQRVRIHTALDSSFLGIIGSKPPHLLSREERERVMPLKDLFIDVGAASKADVEAMGIQPGDYITPISDFCTMRGEELLVGKALDNRAGCVAAIEVLRHFADESHPNVLYAGATVQEEVGCRGAKTLAQLIQPDIAIAIDVSAATDTPGLENHPTHCNVGEGPLMLVADVTMIPHVGLRRLVTKTAEDLGIHLQFDVLDGGGTDGASFHVNDVGCPTIALGFATRYIHSHTAILAKKDLDDVIRLTTELVKRLDGETVQCLLND